MRNLKRALSLLLSSTLVLGMLVMGGSAASYTDVTSEENVEAIEVLKAVGVMTGDENGNFNPDKQVTRAEMAVVMANLLDLKVEDFKGASIPFTDVPEWAVPYVAACYADGITAGISATQYGSNDSVTTAQAALMMMKALGYFQLDKDFGSDWQVATVKQGSKIDLFEGIEAGASTAMTRNEVAQLTLNALEATMVETDGTNTTITLPGGITIDSGDTKYVDRDAKSGVDYDKAGTDTDDTLQLCENLYGDDLIKDDGVDKFGAPAVTWSYKDYDGVYTDEADYTVVVNKADKDAAYWAEEANNKLEGAGNGTKLNNGTLTGGYQVGDVVNYYVADDGKTIENTIITRYTADVITDVDTDVTESDAEDGVTAYITFESAGTFNDTDIAGYNAKTFVKDAVVGMVEGDDEIIASYVASSVKGSISAYSTANSTYTLDGTKYTMTGSVDDEIDGKVDFDNGNYKLYLDPNGYVIKTEVVEGSVAIGDVFHIASVWTEDSQAYGETTTTFYAQVVYLDGTVKEIELAKAAGVVSEDTDAKKVSEKIEQITDDEVFFTDSKTDVAGTDDVSVALSAWDNSDTDYKIGSIDFSVDDKIKTDATKVGSYYVNSDTVYVVVENSGSKLDVTTKTGGLSFTAADSDVANVIYTTENGSKVASYVVIITDEYNAAETGDYFYVMDKNDYVTVSGGKEYTVYDMNGKKTTVVIDKDETVADETFYTYTEKDGVYSDLNPVEGQKDKAVYSSYYGDLLTTTAFTDYDASNAVIVDAHDTDTYSKSVTTLAAMQTAKKAGYIVTVDAVIDAEDEEVDYIVVTSVKSKSAAAIEDVEDYDFVGNLVADGNNVSVSADATYCTGDSNSDGSKDVTGDLARFLGSLYSKGASEIKFAGKTYTWIVNDGVTVLTGSNWRTGTTGNYTTLVKAIVTDTWGGADSMTAGTYKAALTVDGVVMNYTVTIG